MSNNMSIYDASRQVPAEALKPISGGRLKGMSDINPMWRIKKLTELFGICGIGWKIEITDKRLEQGSANEIVCFVDINLYVKVDGEWSAPIPGMGGSAFVTMEKSGPYTSDECFKMAYTDAISVACKSLGFAADVYYANDRTKYTSAQDKPSAAPSKPVEMQQKPDAQTQQQPPREQPAAQQTGPQALISSAQIGYCKKLQREKGISDNDFHRMVGEYNGGNDDIKQLSKKAASEFINFLNAYAV
jgi:hypothetical protein